MRRPMSAAALLVVGVLPAAGADVPLEAAPPAADYVQTCPVFGNRFLSIDGGETCVRLGGYVRGEIGIGSQYINRIDTKRNNDIAFGARSLILYDARTVTEVGTLQTFASIRFEDVSLRGTVDTGTRVDLERGFVSWAGLTAGKAKSAFDYDINYSFFGSRADDQSTLLINYTYYLPNGFFVVGSLEDPTARQGDLVGASGKRTPQHAGSRMPDLVAAFGQESGIYFWKLSGAYMQMRARTPRDTTHNGFAGRAVVEVDLPSGEGRDRLGVAVAAGNGAGSYVGFDDDIDGFVARGRFDASVGYSGIVSLDHYWSERWSSAFTLFAGQVDRSKSTGEGDRTVAVAAANLVWHPVDGFYMGGELQYYYDKNAPGQSTRTHDNVDHDLYGLFRIQRSF